jgi:threonine aldolase
MNFGSDNTGPVAPQVMEAIVRANSGYASAYGEDDIMDTVVEQVRDVFEAPDAAVYLVATGSSANSIALATHCSPWQRIFCHPLAHVEQDECGAPEFFTGGAKLTLVEGDSGKIAPGALQTAVGSIPTDDVHVVQHGPLAITQTTEAGTVYTLDHIRSLTKIAKAHGMPTFMDGARFTNALVSLDVSAAEMTWKSGIDVVSFGGTKNGLMGVEAVVMFNPDRAWEFELRRKRGGHLFSKHRFLSAQMNAYLTDDLWLQLATKANSAAASLADAIASVPHTSQRFAVDANMMFPTWSRGQHKQLFDAGANYSIQPAGETLTGPGNELVSGRLVTNWATTEAEIGQFVDVLAGR